MKHQGDKLTGPLLALAIFALLTALALGCGAPASQSIAGTWRSWIGTVDDQETPTNAGCGSSSSLGTLTFVEPVGNEVGGRWDACGGAANMGFRGALLPDGWTLGIIVGPELLSALPRSADPARMTFELRGLGFSGQHLLVLERAVVRHGKLEIEQ